MVLDGGGYSGGCFNWPQIVPLQKSISVPDARQAEASWRSLALMGNHNIFA